MVFRFRMLSDENDNFVRDYEVPYDMTLLDFHNFILRSLEYEECMASFFTADERWEKLREFTLMDMDDGSEGAPAAMESVTLGQIIHNNRDRLIYLFDMFGDRAYFLELTGAYEMPKDGSYPREIYAQADAPDQYDPSKTATAGEGSIFDEVMGEFNDFEGDDNASYNCNIIRHNAKLIHREDGNYFMATASVSTQGQNTPILQQYMKADVRIIVSNKTLWQQVFG